jgi:hypothetical protein
MRFFPAPNFLPLRTGRQRRRVVSRLVSFGAWSRKAGLKLKADLPFHENDADLLRILKETPMSWLD